jgi:hypothetical protein
MKGRQFWQGGNDSKGLAAENCHFFILGAGAAADARAGIDDSALALQSDPLRTFVHSHHLKPRPSGI